MSDRYPTLLPSNRSQLEHDLEQSQARMADIPVEIVKLWNPAECPADLLPWLAWALSVDYWEPVLWDEQAKRGVTAQSVELHRHKGTPWSMKYFLELIGLPDTEIVEWWQDDPDGLFSHEPHTFCLRVYNQGRNRVVMKQEIYALIEKILNNVKPARSHYCFQIGVKIGGTLAMGGASHVLGLQRLSGALSHQAPAQTLALGAGGHSLSVLRQPAVVSHAIDKVRSALSFGAASHLLGVVRCTAQLVSDSGIDAVLGIGGNMRTRSVVHV